MSVKPLVLSTLILFLACGLSGRSIAQQPSADPAVASGSFRLIGTISSTPMQGAVLEDASGVQTFYRLHEALPDGSQCILVRNDHILLKRPDGAVYEVFISQNSKSAIQTLAPPAIARPASPSTAGLSSSQEEKLRKMSPQRNNQRRVVPSGRMRGTDEQE
jgi:hypothetical protein